MCMYMQIGDIVTRQSYDNDIQFVIETIIGDQAILSGLYYRLQADALINDLVICNIQDETPSVEDSPPINNYYNLFATNFSLERFLKDSILYHNCFVKVLHIDSNKRYLQQCLDKYTEANIPVIGYNIKEQKQPDQIEELLLQYHPNILVITGHDSSSKEHPNSKNLEHYLNSKYFVKSIQAARTYKQNYDDLVIISGGCKSCYEALIHAGANYASSPDRVLVNVTDPVTIACSIANTTIHEFVSMNSIASKLSFGLSEFGGVETRGQCRDITPPIYE